MMRTILSMLFVATRASSDICLIDTDMCDLNPGGSVGEGATCIQKWSDILGSSCTQDSDCEVQVHPTVLGGLTCHENVCMLSCYPGRGVTNMFDVRNFECHGKTSVPERHTCAAHASCSGSKIQQYNDICCAGGAFAPSLLAIDYLSFVCAHPISGNLYR